MTAPSQAIAFDLDDTLYPEWTYVLSGFQAVAEWAQDLLGIPAQQGFAELSEFFHAGIRGDTFNHWLRSHRQPEEPWLRDMIRVYREHVPILSPYEDVIPCLRSLMKRYRLGIITEGFREVQESKLQALRLPNSFDSVIITDISEVENWKPSTVPFKRFLKEISIPVERAWYVGDNPRKDFEGGRKLGMATVRLRRSDGLHRDVEPDQPEAQPDYEIDSLLQLTDILRSREVEA